MFHTCHRLILALSLSLLSLLTPIPSAYAQNAQTNSDGAPYWARTATVGASTPVCLVKGVVGTTACALFPAGDINNFRTVQTVLSGAGHCCWVGATPSAISARLTVTDAGGPFGTGQGACWHVLSTSQGPQAGRPNRTQMIAAQSSGTRRGLCSTAVVNAGDTLYAPCLVDADCTLYGGGTCTQSPSTTQQSSAAAFLSCVSDSGTISFSASKLRWTKTP